MKIKIHKSRITRKKYTKPSFPRIIKGKTDDNKGGFPAESGQVYSMENAPVVFSEPAAAGFYGIKNFTEIMYLMKPDREKFGECLNTLIKVFTDIIETDGGISDNFSGNGAHFAYMSEISPKKALENAFIAALRMRYIINKLNRQWNFSRNPWKVSVGIDYGQVQFEKRKSKKGSVVSISGKPVSTANGIGLSASSGQVLVTEKILLKFPSLTDKFDIGKSFHVPVSGKDFLCKINELVGMSGPGAKKIFEVYV